MISAHKALERLREGNQRFVLGLGKRHSRRSHLMRTELTNEQEPFAIILGCSDSRVPTEIVFDQGLGDLFVIRVAGNIVAPTQVASVEFAALQYWPRLVVVLGHSQCRAVLATLEELRQPTKSHRRNPHPIFDRIRAPVDPLLITDLRHDFDALLRGAVRANIDASVSHLRRDSMVLEQLTQNEGLLIVGAEYSVETGQVEFFDGAKADAQPRYDLRAT